MTPLEKDIERSLVNRVNALGGLCLKWVCPGWAGVPDRIILLPGGDIWFAELKRPKGGQADERQKWWANKLTELGFRHRFVFTHEDAKALTEELQACMRRMENPFDYQKMGSGPV